MGKLNHARTRSLQGIATVSALLVFFNNCSGGYDTNGTSASLSSQSTGVAPVQLNMTIPNPSGGAPLFDSSKQVNFTGAAGTYTVNIACNGAPAGMLLQLSGTETDKPADLNVVQQFLPISSSGLQCGSNTVLFKQGDWNLALSATAPNMPNVQKPMGATVTCNVATPFTSVSVGTITATADPTYGPNVYDFSIGSITPTGGQAPYFCALDPTGSGIIDTAYQPCTTAFTHFYTNYVGVRTQVGVSVIDSCGVAVSSPSHTVNVAYSSTPYNGHLSQNVYIFGTTSNAKFGKSTVVNDPRFTNVVYLATNNLTAVPNGGSVTPGYTDADDLNSNGNGKPYGKGSFSLNAIENYNHVQSSLTSNSPNFGVSLNISGITGSINPAAPVALSLSGATMSVNYTTDEIGDSAGALSFSGSCAFTGQIQALHVSGSPCTAPYSGDTFQGTVEVAGTFTCTSATGTALTDSAGDSIDFTGTFDGFQNLKGSCNGGNSGSATTQTGF
jgi:hypothetical protein